MRVAPGPRSLYPQRLEDADDLFSVFVEWAQALAVAEGSKLPWFEGVWWSSPTTKRDPETGEAYAVDASALGFRDVAAVRRVVAWVEPRLERVAGLWFAADMLADLSRLSSRARARWATEEPERRVSAIACPRCSAHSLVVHPPRVEGAAEQVVCARPSCGLVLAEEDWRRLRAWSVVVARMGAR